MGVLPGSGLDADHIANAVPGHKAVLITIDARHIDAFPVHEIRINLLALQRHSLKWR